MSKYGKIACLAASSARNGMEPGMAWKKAAEKVFPDQRSSRDKGCPRCAFLGLAGEGLIVGISSGKYTDSEDNKRYALAGVALLRERPGLCDEPRVMMWRCIMHKEENENKTHNNQMDVVVGLWKNGYIERDA